MSLIRRAAVSLRFTRLKRRFNRDWAQFFVDRSIWPSERWTLAENGSLRLDQGSVEIPVGHTGGQILAHELQAVERIADMGITFQRREEWFTVKIRGIEAYIRHRSDLAATLEVWGEELYRYELPEPHLVLDVGSNIGLATLFFAEQGAMSVHSYELVPETAAEAEANYALNPSLTGRIQNHAEGLASADGDLEIALDPDGSQGNSIFRGEGEKRVQVKLRNALVALQNLIKQHPELPIIVKLDAEGSEYEIVDCWHQSRLLKRIDLILIEWHGSDTAKLDKLKSQLREAGFRWFERRSSESPVGFLSAYRR